MVFEQKRRAEPNIEQALRPVSGLKLLSGQRFGLPKHAEASGRLVPGIHIRSSAKKAPYDFRVHVVRGNPGQRGVFRAVLLAEVDQQLVMAECDEVTDTVAVEIA
jgi:hypothetical protein